MTYTALVLAARRPGEINPLSSAEGVSHKCLIDMVGRPMIAWVVECLANSPDIGKILICIDEVEAVAAIPPLDRLAREGRLAYVPSGDNLFESVKLGLSGDVTYPVLVTTADNALMTPEMIAHYCASVKADRCDVGVAITRAETIWAKYPEGQRRPHRFADGRYSNCNIFTLRSTNALRAAKAFEGGGQFGKSKMRVLQAFGIFNLLLYLSKRLTLAQTFRRISKRFGVRVAPIELPFAEAPIDVDNERTARIAREVLQARAQTGVAA